MNSRAADARRYVMAMLGGLVAMSLCLSLVPGVILTVDNRMALRRHSDPVLVFGDSRAVHGLDLAMLTASLGRPALSYAEHGAGVYDLLVFAELAPAGASTILAPSLPMMIREKHLDWNRSGLSWRALSKLLRSGFSPSDGLRIFAENRRVFAAHVTEETEPYPNSDEVQMTHWELFEQRYGDPDIALFDTKWSVFWAGVDRLLEKGCIVVLLEVPVSPELRELREQSELHGFSDRLTEQAAKRGMPAFMNARLESPHNLMYDHSHLNDRGRALYTSWAVERILPKLQVAP